MEVYLREQPRYHFTSTERENTNPHHIGTTQPHIYRIPFRGLPQKSGGHNPHTTCPPKEHAQRMQDIHTQGRDCQGNTQLKEYNKTSQQARPKGVGLTCQRHPITPTISQKCSPKNPPRAGTAISTTSHVPQQITSARTAATQLPQSTVEETPADMKNDKVSTTHKPASPHCNPKKD